LKSGGILVKMSDDRSSMISCDDLPPPADYIKNKTGYFKLKTINR